MLKLSRTPEGRIGKKEISGGLCGFFFVSTHTDRPSQKSDIINNNKNKAGIYLWFNNINGKTYV